VNITFNGSQVANASYIDQWATRSLDLQLQANVPYLVSVMINWNQAKLPNETYVYKEFGITVQGSGKATI